ncbi:hypothetical protein [Faecalibacter sp. LW9]|uniref:hypothetical protein n=1 Tax=Faecalibacter sp. LW9 TaxID=3103144 RepID=UPI002AFFD164|nr:hypothetical protein [Faecalibacter sp. LW9]
MKKNILIIGALACSTLLYSQVGINTENPQAMFHIDGSKNNPAIGTPSNSEQSDDFVITEDGNIGLGTISPKVRLDLRASSDTNNAIGISGTTKSASDAGAGAIRYIDQSGGRIQVSNGITWENIASVPTKANIVARINEANNTQKFTYNVVKNVTGWEEMYDPTSSFDPVTGIFTAPRDGIYTVSFTFNFVNGPILANSSVESQIIKNGNTVAIKCLKTYGKSTRPAQSAGNCVSSIFLEEGETINARLLQLIDNTTSGGRGLRSSTTVTNPFFGFNNLTIVEQ